MRSDGVKHDFFISYNEADTEWAEWIAWTLEDQGYSTIVQVWDIRPGNNFVLEMDKATKRSRRTILVVSPNFMKSTFVRPEWASAFSRDPEGEERAIIPVIVEECDTDGLLSSITQINLVGLDDAVAADTLLGGVTDGRAKPSEKPKFPGSSAVGVKAKPTAGPRKTGRLWSPLETQVNVQWRVDPRYAAAGATTVELHLIPVPPVLLEARELSAAEGEAASIGRELGLFADTDGLEVARMEDGIAIERSRIRDRHESGLQVFRNGEVSAWQALPHDNMGSILDPHDLPDRIERLL